MNIASRIFFIEIVNIRKKTKNNPNHPKITAIESKFEPKSLCSKFCIFSKLIDDTLSYENSTFISRELYYCVLKDSLSLAYLLEVNYELIF